MALPTKIEARDWFWARWPGFLDDCCELMPTKMVEAFSSEYPGTEEWLNNADHWIWGVSLELEETVELVKKGYLTV